MRNGQQTVPALLLVGTAWAASQQAPVHQVWQTISAQRTHSEAGQSVDDHVRIGLSRFGLVEVRFRMTQGSPAVTEVIAQARRFSVYTATEGLHLVAERSEIRGSIFDGGREPSVSTVRSALPRAARRQRDPERIDARSGSRRSPPSASRRWFPPAALAPALP